MSGPEGGEPKVRWEDPETQRMWEEIKEMKDNDPSVLLKLVDFMQRPDVAEQRDLYTLSQLEKLGLIPTKGQYVDEAEMIIRGERIG